MLFEKEYSLKLGSAMLPILSTINEQSTASAAKGFMLVLTLTSNISSGEFLYLYNLDNDANPDPHIKLSRLCIAQFQLLPAVFLQHKSFMTGHGSHGFFAEAWRSSGKHIHSRHLLRVSSPSFCLLTSRHNIKA